MCWVGKRCDHHSVGEGLRVWEGCFLDLLVWGALLWSGPILLLKSPHRIWRSPLIRSESLCWASFSKKSDVWLISNFHFRPSWRVNKWEKEEFITCGWQLEWVTVLRLSRWKASWCWFPLSSLKSLIPVPTNLKDAKSSWLQVQSQIESSINFTSVYPLSLV